MQKLIKLFAAILLFNTSTLANNNFTIIKEWHLSGFYQTKGDNSFYLDFLKDFGGEENLQTDNLNWKIIKSDSNGYIDLSKQNDSESGRQICYLYSVLESEEEKNLALTLGYTGGLQIWVNGKKVYNNRISRKPIADNDAIAIQLEKGTNNILVKAEGGGSYFGFYFKLYNPEGNIFINEAKIICPDFRIGQPIKAWGQIEILNTGIENISSINVSVVKNSFMIPSSQTAYNIYPGEARKIPFLLSTNDVVTEEPLSLQLKIKSKGIEKIINVKPYLRKAGEYFVTTYRSKLDGSVQPYSLLLPKSFDPNQQYPFILLLHGAWVTSWGQNIISYDPKDWAVQAAVHGRGNNRYREIGDVELNEVINDVKKHYKIDEDKMYLAGHSMGGYGTWFQAVRYPDRWTAISPQAGYVNYFLYADEKKMPAFLKKLYKEWSPVLFAENLLHIPSYIVHGAKDDNVSVEHAREMSARLDSLNYNFVYDENPEGGHWWGPRGENYGMEVVDKPEIWSYLQKFNKRKENPKKVIYKTNSLRYNKAYWVTIDEMDSLYSMAEIIAEIEEENKIDIQIENIKQFTLHLNDSLLNLNEPAKIFINSELAFNDFIPESKCVTIRKAEANQFEILYDTYDFSCLNINSDKYISGQLNEQGKVEKLTIQQNKKQKKNHNIFGPVIDAFNSPFLFVVGESNQNNELSKAIEYCARTLAKSWEISANGNIKIKNDNEVTQEDILSQNLILFGNVETNKIIAEINEQLPFKFDNGKILSGKENFSEKGIGFIEAYPNPLNPTKYIVIVGGVDKESFLNASHISFEKLPDYIMYNAESFDFENIQYILSGFFNKNWELDK